MAWPIFRDSIGSRILLLMLAIVLPITLMLTWFFILNLQHTQAEADAKVSLLAENSARILGDYLLEHEKVLIRIAARPMVKALDPDHCDPVIANYVALNPAYTTLAVRDLHANPVCSFLPNPAGGNTMIHSSGFIEAMRNEGFTASGATLGSSTGRWISALAQPIRDSTGKKIGLVRIAIDLQKLSDDLLGSVPKDALVSVIDQHKNILLRSTQAHAFIGQPSSTLTTQSVRGLRQGILTVKGLDGVLRRTAFVTIPGVEWRVTAGLPEQQLLADFRLTLWRSVAIGIATLVLVIALAWRIGIAIIRPIRDLAATVALIANGDRTARAKLAGPAELAMVGQQFNSMLDIFERHEIALKNSEQNLAITLQSIGDAVIATDAAGLITRMNPTAERLTNWPLSAAIGQPLSAVFQIINTQTRVALRSPAQLVMECGSTVELPDNTALLARDGHEYRIADSAAPIRNRAGKIIGVVLVFSDITERHRIAAEKMLSVAQMQQAFDASPIGMALVALDGRFLRTNPVLSQMLGWSEAELLQRDFQAITSPPDLAADLALVAEVIAGKCVSFQLDKRYLHKNGSEVWTQLNVSLVRDRQGAPLHFVSQIQNITERKQVQDALQASLAEKVSLLNEVHHRVKNNLQVITSLLRLENARSSEPETKSVLNDIKGRIRSMALLHESLYRSGIFTSVDLSTYLKELCTQAFRTLSAQDGLVRLQLDLAMVHVSMDQATPCGLLVNELVSNSLKHAFPDGHSGTISISLQSIENSNEVRLTVSDDGIGFPADFEIKRAQSLGLQLVADLVRQLKGKLAIESGAGAIFSVSFTPDQSKSISSNT
jgi:PAS domain S-box-containing protein